MPICKSKENSPAIFGFLKDEKLTDCCLSTEGSLIRAHKLILAASSKYFEELFILLEEKHPVVVLKDVSIKFLLLILEYVYLGTVEIEDEDVKGFKEVAKILQIRAEFEEEPEEMSQDLLTELPDEEMSSSVSNHTVERASSEEMEVIHEPTRKITSGRKFEEEEDAHKKGPPPKKLKQSFLGLKSASGLVKKIQSSEPPLNPCTFCDRRMKEKDRKYHQKFCWENPSRIISDCKHCDKKFQVPGKLRAHINQAHPEFKY